MSCCLALADFFGLFSGFLWTTPQDAWRRKVIFPQIGPRGEVIGVQCHGFLEIRFDFYGEDRLLQDAGPSRCRRVLSGGRAYRSGKGASNTPCEAKATLRVYDDESLAYMEVAGGRHCREMGSGFYILIILGL